MLARKAPTIPMKKDSHIVTMAQLAEKKIKKNISKNLKESLCKLARFGDDNIGFQIYFHL